MAGEMTSGKLNDKINQLFNKTTALSSLGALYDS